MNPTPTFEELRASYRPDRITTLFVGESAPYAGTFFYNETSGLFREVRKAFRGKEFFLENFKRNGFYMDDLVREPVNQLDGKARRSLCHQAIASLAKRLEDYKPKAIVILLHRIKPMVLNAMSQAGLQYEPYCTPYPGFGNQPRFHQTIAEIIPNLPVALGNQWKEYHS